MFPLKLIGTLFFVIRSFLRLNVPFYIPKGTIVYASYVADIPDACLDNTSEGMHLVQNVCNVVIQLLRIQTKNICP